VCVKLIGSFDLSFIRPEKSPALLLERQNSVLDTSEPRGKKGQFRATHKVRFLEKKLGNSDEKEALWLPGAFFCIQSYVGNIACP
jgi:hypothetical protein